jgi:energy-coupling factor transporter ATP-binding protein EcfA2
MWSPYNIYNHNNIEIYYITMSNDLLVLPPAKDNFKMDYKMELNENLPDFHKGILLLLIGQPGAGKTVIILNLLGRFLKHYYEEVHFIGGAFKYDKTLSPLIDYYGNQNDSCSDTVFNNIKKKRLEMNDDPNKGNCAIIVDDLMAMPDFNARSSSSMSKLASVYRHVLGGAVPTKKDPDIKRSGGLLLISNQRLFSSIPRNLRACANVIILGKVANAEEYGQIISEYSLTFGGKKALEAMIQLSNGGKYNFLCLYLNGVQNTNIDGPCVFLNFNTLLYPSARFPKKTIDISTLD